MCDGGVATWKRSSWVSPRARHQCAVPSAMERWVWRTALGLSVVPELNTKTASSSSPKAEGGGRGAALVRSATAAAPSSSSRSSTRVGPRRSESRAAPVPSAIA